MQNDRICVSDSQSSLNRSTNNCPVVTGNCRGITEICGLAIRNAHCLACQQERGTGHNKLGKARTAPLLTARHKKAHCTQNAYRLCQRLLFETFLALLNILQQACILC